MNHPADWGKGSMQEITSADVVIGRDDEGIYEFLKDRTNQFDKKVKDLTIIFVDCEGNRHIFVAHRVEA